MPGQDSKKASTALQPRRVYHDIGTFLFEHHLAPDPANYAFAYRLFGENDTTLWKKIRLLTEDGVRLTKSDIAELIGNDSAAAGMIDTQAMVAHTSTQIAEFEDVVGNLRVETQGFGRELEASASAMRTSAGDGLDDIMQITTAMIERVQLTESRLDATTREASDLRARLDAALNDARRDPLTGLHNRRAFDEQWDKAREEGRPRALALCDVDRFKLVNDRFGHAVGDRVLKAIAESLSETCAPHLVARYGGEEFAVLFVDVDGETAQQTLETARRQVEAKRFRVRESDEPLGTVTFSAGLCGAAAHEERSDILRRTDALLYQAKDGGRNRICAAV